MGAKKLNALISWAKENGAQINDSIDFTATPTKGVSAVLQDDLTQTIDLIKVPRDILFTPDLSAKYFQIDFKGLNTGNEPLMLLLAKLKFDSATNQTKAGGLNLSEKFKDYIDYLPSSGREVGSPYFWNLEEKELLKGTDAHIILFRTLKSVVEDWKASLSQIMTSSSSSPALKKQIKTDLGLYHSYVKGNADSYLCSDEFNNAITGTIKSWTSFPAFLWSYCIFASRAFPYLVIDPKIENRSLAFLLPIVDLLNHENDQKVSWEFKDNSFVFHVKEAGTKLVKGAELHNNYGDKANVGLMLGYGFVLDMNIHDETTVSLKVDKSALDNASRLGIEIPDDAAEVGMNFHITQMDPLPSNLVDFFASLVQINDEKDQYTLRMKLEGLAQLRPILESKVALFKNFKLNVTKNTSQDVVKTVKTYRNTQKTLFQRAVDTSNSLEKILLQDYKPLSFKTVMKKDQRFATSLLLTFGITGYEDLIKNGILDHAALLWIVRNANKKEYSNVDQSIFPDFISKAFENVKKTITITKEDVLEYRDMYNSLFPVLSEKVPEIYGKGEWTAKNIIIAGKVHDQLEFTRNSNNELFLLDKVLIK